MECSSMTPRNLSSRKDQNESFVFGGIEEKCHIPHSGQFFKNFHKSWLKQQARCRVWNVCQFKKRKTPKISLTLTQRGKGTAAKTPIMAPLARRKPIAAAWSTWASPGPLFLSNSSPSLPSMGPTTLRWYHRSWAISRIQGRIAATGRPRSAPGLKVPEINKKRLPMMLLLLCKGNFDLDRHKLLGFS